MGNLLYIIAVILVIAWILGYFAFHVTGGLIHALLVIAVIAVILQVIRGNRSV
ncbi:MAG: lmo0937 family membrane protein [Williamsia sp.]|nr:lmo0937 family membrane protein [Williamsia sp.]